MGRVMSLSIKYFSPNIKSMSVLGGSWPWRTYTFTSHYPMEILECLFSPRCLGALESGSLCLWTLHQVPFPYWLYTLQQRAASGSQRSVNYYGHVVYQQDLCAFLLFSAEPLHGFMYSLQKRSWNPETVGLLCAFSWKKSLKFLTRSLQGPMYSQKLRTTCVDSLEWSFWWIT